MPIHLLLFQPISRESATSQDKVIFHSLLFCSALSACQKQDKNSLPSCWVSEQSRQSEQPAHPRPGSRDSAARAVGQGRDTPGMGLRFCCPSSDRQRVPLHLSRFLPAFCAVPGFRHKHLCCALAFRALPHSPVCCQLPFPSVSIFSCCPSLFQPTICPIYVISSFI